MINTLFWILLATWLRTGTQSYNQLLVDNNNGVAIQVSDYTWCNWTYWIAAHNYKKLWQKIIDLQIWDKLTYNWCTYKATNYTIEEIQTYDINQLKKPGTMFLQTCADDSLKYAYIVELKALSKRKIYNSKMWWIKK